MNKLLLAAAVLMATTSAHAGNLISFAIDGHKVRIEAPKHCDSLSCIQISAPGLSGSGFNLNGFKSKHDDDDVATDTVTTAPAPAPAPVVQAAAPQITAPVVTTPAPAASTAVASTDSMPGVGFDAPTSVTAAPAAVQPAPVAAAPAPTTATPLGIWATEENKGNVRVEQCGRNLCGYAVKTGDKILINMKPQASK